MLHMFIALLVLYFLQSSLSLLLFLLQIFSSFGVSKRSNEEEEFSICRSLQASTSKELDLCRSSCGCSVEAEQLHSAISNQKRLSSTSSYLWRSASHNLVTSFELVRVVFVDLRVRSRLQHRLDRCNFYFQILKYMLNHIIDFEIVVQIRSYIYKLD